MRWKLFADLAERAGDDEINVSVDDSEPTAGDALDALLAEYPQLADRVFTADGDLESHLNLLRNGENVSDTGLATPVSDDDELALFPPVSGG
ncbi:molybdopterin synthase sulfur carrier subunit [Halonotius aquaticus]|uniref:Molybdopterin synthase sulfur carrier subunit n=1 Tax=Halonotius aquaticus TaxID=2216978 RepID=A0A3A6PQS1_9EURY|nr:ubiquitin-like small modifier protein 1 [Halonotius aquaticus]RJX42853.1 molybdopterin synthase sulfur carrier subunit [Halonotius aquaticus]